MRRTGLPFRVMLVFLGLLIGLTVYGVWWVNHWSAEEVQTLGAAHDLREAVDAYMLEHNAYPVELALAGAYLTRDSWPDNPYTGAPLADTGSGGFDPQASPGNVYYERVFNAPPAEGYAAVASDRRQVGFVIHVFGGAGEIWTYRGRARLPVD